MRDVLAIPLDELKQQFQSNERQDVKVVTPQILTEEVFQKLKEKGKKLKQEKDFDGVIWQHSPQDKPNNVIESGDFLYSLGTALNNIEIAFGNENSTQDSHFHSQYAKILYSESHINVKWRRKNETEVHEIDLKNGGLIFISPLIIHLQKFWGITLSMRLPMGGDDKVKEDL